MAIHHAASGELIDIRPLRAGLARETTRALYKSDTMEVFRAILLAGKSMPEHRVKGEITVQCLEGSIEFRDGPQVRIMREGELLCLAGGRPHSLRAIDDASVLVTILLHPAPTKE